MKNTKTSARSQELKELGFLEALSRRCPHDAEILKALGNLYTTVGRHEDGLETDRELIQLCPADPVAWYNLGCSYALLDLKDKALDSLARAVDLGYADVTWMRKDADLESLRNDERFIALLRRTSPCA